MINLGTEWEDLQFCDNYLGDPPKKEANQMKVELNNKREGKNYKAYQEFIANLEKAEIGAVIGFVTKNKTVFLVKTKESKHYSQSTDKSKEA